MLDAEAAEAALAAESKRAERKKRAVSTAGHKDPCPAAHCIPGPRL